MIIGIPVGIGSKTIYLNHTYINYVQEGGHDVRLLHLGDMSVYDGLLLPGGTVLDPMYYGMDNVDSMKPRPEYDKYQRALLWKYLARDKPILGICRGFQLIFLEMARNSHKYYKQHIPNHVQSSSSIDRHVPSHFVTLKNGDRWPVNSLHHQGIKMTQDLRDQQDYVRGWTADDIVEMIQFGRALGVQWHPEEMNQQELLLLAFGK